MEYNILPYTYKRARQLNVVVYPSDNPKYKLEIYDETGDFMYYGGAAGYSDYPHYIESHGKEYADKRRLLYHKRHKKELDKVWSRGWVVSKLLW